MNGMSGPGAADVAGTWPLVCGDGQRPILLSAGRIVTLAQFLADAQAVAADLPCRAAAMNLCERRDNFLLGFAATAIRGQPTLLPPSRAPGVIQELLAEHPGCYVLTDDDIGRYRLAGSVSRAAVPRLPGDQVVALGYTSGSTGRSRPNRKTWEGFAASTALNASAISAGLPEAWRHGPSWIVATVPPQHMYGMELSVLMPLLGDAAVHAGQPLFPVDVATALGDVPRPRILVSTPVHLRVLLDSGIRLPALDLIVSATAPMGSDLAAALEHRFDTALLEMFGSTETCVIASRRTAHEETWRPYQGIRLAQGEESTRVGAPWLEAAVELQDVLRLQHDGSFVVIGRNSDLIEVAGKRASLSDLTRRLLAIPGVSDAVVFQPDPEVTATARRVAALVVTNSGLTEAEIKAGLAPSVDPVFLPRPLVIVDRLPRNEVGKLPRAQLLAMLEARAAES
jgi:acyl-coenzyme A synthetase/AMP-(fatty) acid ligase